MMGLLDKDYYGRERWGVTGLLDKAEELLDQFQPDLALQFCQRAVSISQSSQERTQSLRALAAVLIELGNRKKAKQIILEQITPEHVTSEEIPEHNAKDLLTLAQLSEGEEALRFYQLALSKLSDDSEDRRRTLCSIVELFMTDLCDHPDAEGLCLAYLERALKMPTKGLLYEVHKLYADYHLIRAQDEEARRHMLLALQGLGQENDDAALLSMEFREACAQNCIELGMWPEAEELLRRLVAEDDEHLMSVYLYALCCYHLGLKAECLEWCQYIVNKLEKTSLEQEGDESNEDHQLIELAAAVQELQAQAHGLSDEDHKVDEHAMNT
jgi:tetratricopeptide (TPR) repeat protein